LIPGPVAIDTTHHKETRLKMKAGVHHGMDVRLLLLLLLALWCERELQGTEAFLIFCWRLVWTWKHRPNKPHACRWPAALLATGGTLGQ